MKRLSNLNFEFQKNATSDNILVPQMISAKKLMNIKVVELIKIYNFYFGHLFIRDCGSNIVHKIYISGSFINYKRDV